MAKSSALTVITREAKSLKKKHPHKFDHLKKKDRWSKGYIKQASAAYNGKAGTPKKRKKKVGAPRKPAKKRASGRKLVKYVEKTSTERVMSGKKKRCHCTHRAYMAGVRTRRRSVGSSGGGSTGLLLGLGAAVALYFIMKPSTPTTPVNPATLPPIQQTGNYTRDTQSQNIINYALAAGIAANSIIDLINKLNSSSDSDVGNIYDSISTTGDVGAWV